MQLLAPTPLKSLNTSDGGGSASEAWALPVTKASKHQNWKHLCPDLLSEPASVKKVTPHAALMPGKASSGFDFRVEVDSRGLEVETATLTRPDGAAVGTH